MPDQLNTCTEQQLFKQQFTGKSCAKMTSNVSFAVMLILVFVFAFCFRLKCQLMHALRQHTALRKNFLTLFSLEMCPNACMHVYKNCS